MSKITFRLRTLWMLSLLMLCTGCEWIMDGIDTSGCTQRVRIEVDWSLFDDELPTGMSVVVYEHGSATPDIIPSNDLDYVHVTVRNNSTYHAAVINNSPEEFTRLIIVDRHSADSVLLTTHPITDSWYSRRQTLAGSVNEQPETFAYDFVSFVDVTDSLLLSDGIPTMAYLTPVIVTQQVEIIVQGRGLEYVTELRGSLTGMASGYYPNLLHTTSERTTFLTDEWSVVHPGARLTSESHRGTRAKRDSDYNLKGTMVTFGRAYGYTDFAPENVLTLQATLTDGSLYEQSFAVGNRFTRISDRIWRITVSAEVFGSDAGVYIVPEPSHHPVDGNGQSGFDATVNDWADAEDFDFAT